MSVQTLDPSLRVFDKEAAWSVPAVRVGAPAPAVAVTQRTNMIPPALGAITSSVVAGFPFSTVNLATVH